MTDVRQGAGDAGDIVRYMQIDLPRLFHWIYVKWHWVALLALAGALLAVAYTMVAQPRYTVTTELLADPAGLLIMQDDLYGRPEQRDTQLLAADGLLRTLLSRNVLGRVVEKLELQKDREFVPPPSLLRSILPSSGSADPAIVALASLREKAVARRDEASYVITLSVSTRDPEKSILISETIVAEFKAELGAADTDGAVRTAKALASRLAELKQDVNKAEEAVETFRREHDLRASQGELLSSRSMAQVSTQLNEARQALQAAEARHSELTNSGGDSAAIQSPTLSALRARYAEARQRVDSGRMIYGPRHPELLTAQRELQSVESEIDAEMARLTRAAENEVNQARARLDALRSDLGTISSDVFGDNEAQIRLRELLRESQAKSAIYESFLVRARVAAERQNLDTSNIREISPPVPPSARNWPPGKLSAAVFGAGAGMILGVLAAMTFGIYADTRPPRGAPQPAPVSPAPVPPLSARAAAAPNPRPRPASNPGGRAAPAMRSKSTSLLAMGRQGRSRLRA